MIEVDGVDVTIAEKFVGDRALLERCVVTLAEAAGSLANLMSPALASFFISLR